MKGRNRRQKRIEDLRSQRWFAPKPTNFGHRSRTLQNGYNLDEFEGRPIIAVINTWSDLGTCHGHLRETAEVVKRGIISNGGFPVELPAMSLGEQMVKPSTMMYRNFLAMETEELLRSHPVDGVVLLGGCDKTTPALLMGAISMNLPTIFVPAGFMLHGHWRGQRLGSGVDAWTYGSDLMAGKLSLDEWFDLERHSARTVGTCNVMGTASTMTSIAEALGMALPFASSVPAVDSRHRRFAQTAGARCVDLVWQNLRPTDVLTESAFRNAAIVNFALGGSTNAAIHLLALAGRVRGVNLNLTRLDEIAAKTPVIANVLPSGKYLMEDFGEAGGLPAAMARLREQLDLTCVNVSGVTVEEIIADAQVMDADVIRSVNNPIASTSFAALFGNLAPDGCVIKPSAASRELLQHKGRAVVFNSRADLDDRIDDPALEITESTVLVLRNAGPKGAPGMPEWGMLPMPKRLSAAGVRDMVRISDARMSGTSFGTVVLHVSPEAHVGGPLALVEDGDVIELDVERRRIHLDVPQEELEKRRATLGVPSPKFERGYGRLYVDNVSQAHQGCDFEFLARDGQTAEPEIFH